MKLKTSSGRLMSLLIIPISFFCACNFTKTPTAEKAIQVADSVAIYYYQSGFLSFAAISEAFRKRTFKIKGGFCKE